MKSITSFLKTKKYQFLLIGLLLNTSLLYSQTKKMTFEVQFGIQSNKLQTAGPIFDDFQEFYNTFYDEIQSNSNNKLGYYIGFLLNRSLTKRWQLKSGILVKYQASSWQSIAKKFGNDSFDPFFENVPSDELLEEQRISIDLDYLYLHIPLVLDLNFPIGNSNLSLGAGAYYDFKISGDQQIKSFNDTFSGPGIPLNTAYEIDDFAKHKYGLVTNIGLQWKINNNSAIGLKYALLRDFDASIQYQISSSTSFLNFERLTHQVGLTYEFGANK